LISDIAAVNLDIQKEEICSWLRNTHTVIKRREINKKRQDFIQEDLSEVRQVYKVEELFQREAFIVLG
jgi:hypothetical protein